MADITAVNSIVISRVRSGDLLTLALTSTKSLSQYYGVDEAGDVDATTIAPDWTSSSAQPTIIAAISSTLDNSATLTDHAWTYAGGGSLPSSTYQVNNDGSLTIIGNVASNTTKNNVIIKFSGNANANGIKTPVSKEVEIQIFAKGGANSYDLWLSADDGVINTSDDEITIQASLTYNGVAKTSDVAYQWFFNNVQDDSIPTTSSSHTVTKDDINGSTLVTVKALYQGGIVATRSVTILDYTDPLIIQLNATNGGTIASSSDTTVVSVSVASGDFSVTDFDSVKYEVYRTDIDEPIDTVEGTGATTITIDKDYTDYAYEKNSSDVWVKTDATKYSDVVVLATVTINS